MSSLVLKKDRFTVLDIQSVALLHKTGITASSLSFLGNSFLEKLYTAIAKSKDSFLIVAIKDSEIVGFVSGAMSKKGILICLIKTNFFSLVLVLFPKIFSLTTIKKMIDVLLYIVKDPKKDYNNASPELLSIVVSEQWRRQGIGQKLFEEMADTFAEHGVQKFKMVVGQSLIHARKFYEDIGAEREKEMELHQGEKSFIYLYECKLLEKKEN